MRSNQSTESNSIESIKPKARRSILVKKNVFAGWEIGSDYKLEKIIGDGSYGEVA
mgnify:CR=1 FL=1